MLITPFVLRALWNGGLLVVIAASVGLWVLAQSGGFSFLANRATAALDLTSDGGFDMSLSFLPLVMANFVRGGPRRRDAIRSGQA